MGEHYKPFGRKAYGSIGHLPESRMGPSDHHVHPGQALICTTQTRDKHDRVIVQEKLDGSCVAIGLINGTIVALGRAGWLAQSSKYEMHQRFADYVRRRESQFRAVLREGERLCGEWMAQAHGTIYDLSQHAPFAAFDIMKGEIRMPYNDFCERLDTADIERPTLLHDGGAISVDDVMAIHEAHHWPCDGIEGVVYRVERKDEVDFLAKFVRHDKVDGKYLSGDPVWLWPESKRIASEPGASEGRG